MTSGSHMSSLSSSKSLCQSQSASLWTSESINSQTWLQGWSQVSILSAKIPFHLFDRRPLICSVHATSSGQIWSRLMWTIGLPGGMLCKHIRLTKNTYGDSLCFHVTHIGLTYSNTSPWSSIRIALTVGLTSSLYSTFKPYPNDQLMPLVSSVGMSCSDKKLPFDFPYRHSNPDVYFSRLHWYSFNYRVNTLSLFRLHNLSRSPCDVFCSFRRHWLH